MNKPPLPVDRVLAELTGALARERRAVLVAPTGAGKTTRVPPALLDAGLVRKGRVVVLEPRRLAARAAARRMAAERGVCLGEDVGYRVRFEARAGARTRLLVVTEGIFLRRIQADPLLEGVGAVVFDEFHERSLESDLALGMARRVAASVRPDLSLLIMSATLDGEGVARDLGGWPLITAEGRSHPVQIVYAPRPLEGRLPERVLLGVRDALGRTTGDVLVFLPGVGEIRAAGRALQDLARQHDLALMELYGDLPAARQDEVLLPGPRRKLVLATNVAETSITIEGLGAVVDTGLARVLCFDADSGLERLELRPISRASADQRAGRAGRDGPGYCLRLWTRGEHENRPARELPAIRGADLAGPVLQLLDWGERDPLQLPWLEAPEPASVAVALDTLTCLGAVREGEITPRGRCLAGLPVAPRLAALLLAGRELGVSRQAALAAALLAERDPFERRRRASYSGRCDVSDRVAALDDFARSGCRDSELGRLLPGAARGVLAVADQLHDLIASPRRREGAGRASARRPGKPGNTQRKLAKAESGRDRAGTDPSALTRALLRAFPDRVARRREPKGARALMVGGGGVLIDPASAVTEGELLLCSGLVGVGRGEPRARLVSRLEPGWLDPELIVEQQQLSFDRLRQAVVARHKRRYLDLLLESRAAGRPDPERAAELLVREAARDPQAALSLGDARLMALSDRLACLALWCPELELPRVDRESILALLPQLCVGHHSFAQLRALPLASLLAARLRPEQALALKRLAPERMALPSGRRAALRYQPGSPPALSARIQEVFGWAQTPTVCNGRIKVVMHLLAPNMRAEQVTDDLPSFWAGTYPRVRRELQRRYPRHDWPEKPMEAVPRRPSGGRRRRGR